MRGANMYDNASLEADSKAAERVNSHVLTQHGSWDTTRKATNVRTGGFCMY